jgi:hypothetical protein
MTELLNLKTAVNDSMKLLESAGLANYRALYGLRKISLEEGQTEPARLYAQQAYDAIAARYDPLAHSWLELIEKDWPDLRHAPQP